MLQAQREELGIVARMMATLWSSGYVHRCEGAVSVCVLVSPTRTSEDPSLCRGGKSCFPLTSVAPLLPGNKIPELGRLVISTRFIVCDHLCPHLVLERDAGKSYGHN